MAALSLALMFAALNTEALQTTVRLLTVPSSAWSVARWYRGSPDWTSARPAIGSLLEEVDVVVSSSQIKTIYELGRTDVSLSRTELYDADPDSPPPEFWIYPTTGRPVISTPGSVERIVSCYASGLFLIESQHWRLPAVVTSETADAIEALAEEIEIPGRARARAFVWRQDESALAVDCGGGVGQWAALGQPM